MKPAHEAVVHHALNQAELPGQQREIVEDVLIDKMRRNAGVSTQEVDQEELSTAVETILGELARSSARYDFVEPQHLSAEQVDSIIDSVCKRYRLPWPICPADD